MQIEELAAQAEQRIRDYEVARHGFANTLRSEQQMEAERAEQKSAAIGRIMATDNPLTSKAHSATSAESIASTDEAYAAFLLNVRNLVHSKLRLETGYHAAYLRAQLSIAVLKVTAGVV